MEHGQKFSNLIYEYFVTRIHFQYYKSGDFLPPIEILCQEFHVSSLTVKAALRRMRKEGYISMHNGKPTEVIFRQTREELEDHISRFFSERWESFSDFYQSSELIFIPLLTEGFCRMTEEDFIYLSGLAERSSADDIIRFYCHTLQKLQNPLAVNLLWESSIFMGFPFVRETGAAAIYDKELIQTSFRRLITAARTGRRDEVYRCFLDFQRKNAAKQMQYYGQRIRPEYAEKPISFSWRIYRERPQLCYSLAIHILYQNYLGACRGEPFLPSYEKMAASFGVSVSTMRRTISLLNQMGAARTVNGKGTCMFPPEDYGDEPDLSGTGIRHNLAYFIQAFEIMGITCEGAARATLLSLPPEKRRHLLCLLEDNLKKSLCELTLWQILHCIAENSPQRGLCEIYGKLCGLFLWGYPLRAAFKDSDHFHQTWRTFTETMVRHLKENDVDTCASAIRNVLTEELPVIEHFLLERGFKAEELRSSPSIMLLLNGQAGD